MALADAISTMSTFPSEVVVGKLQRRELISPFCFRMRKTHLLV